MGHLVDHAAANRIYKIALTIAVLSFLIMLTITIVLILVGNVREEDRQSEFNLTLTAVQVAAQQTIDALADQPHPLPPITPGSYPFALAESSPAYSEQPDCAQQIVSGQVLDVSGQPTDAVRVWVWGDALAPHELATGAAAARSNGEWALALNGLANRRLWVQLAAGEHFVSAPVEIVFAETHCERAHAHVIFEQIAPLD